MMDRHIAIVYQACYLDHCLEHRGHHCQHNMDCYTGTIYIRIHTAKAKYCLLTEQLEELHTQGPTTPKQLST